MDILAGPENENQLRLTTRRIDSIDLLRGLVMIIMALDHTRDFFHINAMTDDPLNFATTTPFLFFTRWITHFCAPVFVFLSGASAFFQSRKKSKSELSSFLIKRGLWLVFVEIVIMNFGFFFDPGYSLIGLQTIWAIGISMIILGLAIWLPFRLILTIGLVIVLGHNLLDFYEAKQMGNFSFIYSLLHRVGFFPLAQKHSILILYPFLPWTGLMMVGYCFGKLFTSYGEDARKKLLTRIGIGIILFFIILRFTNIYGNPFPWSTQKDGVFTVLSFINTQKYPPSLLYMCMTIGPAILFVAWIGNVKNWLTKAITVYGRVPFFYYILHFYILHIIAMLFFALRHHSFVDNTVGQRAIPFKYIIPGEGYSLAIVYLVWISVVILLYPLCKWFSNYRRTHTQWWLSYL